MAKIYEEQSVTDVATPIDMSGSRQLMDTANKAVLNQAEKYAEQASNSLESGLKTSSTIEMGQHYQELSNNPEELSKRFEAMNEEALKIPVPEVRDEVLISNTISQNSFMAKAQGNYRKIETKKAIIASSSNIATNIDSLGLDAGIWFDPEITDEKNAIRAGAEAKVQDIKAEIAKVGADGLPLHSEADQNRMITAINDIKTLGYETNVDELFEVSPDRAESFMQDMELNKVDFMKRTKTEPDEYEDMLSYNKTVRSRFKLAELETQTIGSQQAEEILAEPSLSNAKKKIQINQLLLDGAITKEYTTKAKGVLLSDKAIGASDDADAMADIILRVNDLNARADLDQADYLIGVRNLRDEILDRRTSGQLSEEGSTKLNNQITTLTSAKISGATNIVGYNFDVGSDMFEDQLPPEYRGKAIRELFYQTEGEDPTEEEQKEKATKIIDSINLQRRNTTIKKVSEITKVETPTFNTEEEANAANLVDGQLVVIGGQQFKYRK
jgi:hypothetical protein